MNPLAIIPCYSTEAGDVEVLHTCVRTLRESALYELNILVVDDGSPDEQLVAASAGVCEQFGADFIAKEENEGFSKTVNVGLRLALEEGRDAILVNADIEIPKPRGNRWLEHMLADEADVVGAMLMYPNGLIQHGGVYFSLLTREFDHLWKFAPSNLREANQRMVCPVTGALQLIRHEALVDVGIYDESFRMGWEDMDYCIRVFLSGRTCAYQPKVKAIHHEHMFRGRKSDKLQEWQMESLMRLWEKWQAQSFAGLVPFR